MDIRFLPLLLNQQLTSFGQTNSANAANRDFSNLLTESLLKAEALKNANNSQQPTNVNTTNQVELFSSLLGLNSPILGLLGGSLSNQLGTSLSGISQAGSPSSLGGLVQANSRLQTTNVEGNELNAHLKGVLQNAGESFVAAGKKYNISPSFLAAIAVHETGNGSSNAARFKFNVAGMMGKNGLKTYVSVGESIFDMARNLRQNYLDEGLTTVAQIGGKYAPVGAANDPTNLNNHWVTGVERQFETITKTTDFA